MITFLVALLATGQPAADVALELCKPLLARKAGGEITSIDVASTRTTRHRRIMVGRLTALQGMSDPGPGYAKSHHLIRSDFRFQCRLVNRRVREASVTPQ